MNVKTPSANLSVDREFFDLVTENYRRFLGRPLVLDGQGPDWLYSHAPFALLAHNTDPDPHFIYANRKAQVCFEYSWDEFLTLPSRLSAEVPNRAERQRLLEAVTPNGFIAGVRGLRISKSGRRFWIENCVVWQLYDDDGTWQGQAATYAAFREA
jgi:hypothetical protein